MPNFNSDVVIEGHDLVVLDAASNEIARLGSDGNLTVRREIAGSVLEILRFLSAGTELAVGADGAAGSVHVLNGTGPTVRLSGGEASATIGALGTGGDVMVRDAMDREVFRVDGSNAAVYVGADGNEGDIVVRDESGRDVLHFDGKSSALYVGTEGNEGDIIVRDASGAQVFRVDAARAALYVGAEGNEGDVIVRDGAGREAVRIDSNTGWLRVGTAGNEGDIEVQDGSGRRVMHMNGQHAALYVGADGNEGDVVVRDGAGREVVHVDGNSAWLRVGTAGNEGDIEVQDGSGRRVMHMNGQHAALYVGADGNEGDVVVRDGDGVDRIHLNGATGDIRLMGADLAEDFTSSCGVEPGEVLVAVGPDEVAPAERPHDTRVIGVASGAGDWQPALRLGTMPGEHRVPVGLVGRVFCKADARTGPIVAGDLLTTSPLRGHAMRVSDPAAAVGAIIGKALAPLDEGTGLIPVLLTLQ